MSAQPQHLRRGFLVTGAGFAALVVAALALIVGSRISKSLRDQANQRGSEIAFRVAETVTQYLTERRREIVTLASLPELASTVRELETEAVRRGLDRMDIPTLERLFARRRQLSGERPLLRYLRSYTEISDFSELFLTERHGLVALASGQTSDFVQRDEEWWQRAMQQGSFESQAAFDSAVGAAALEFDVAVRAPGGGAGGGGRGGRGAAARRAEGRAHAAQSRRSYRGDRDSW